MFERLIVRAVRRAREKADAQAARIAEGLAEQAPPGVRVERVTEGVRLSGRGLGRRLMREGLSFEALRGDGR